jgi:predicted GNAT superfamily acetyltransferase
MTVELLRAMAHTGNYVSAAWRGEQLVGASAAFFGRDRGGWILHSHITGVARSARRGGTGFALKQHQRAWALERGITEIRWTFDPLVRRNAWFNLVKLGAVAMSYQDDFYGHLEDGINAGDNSDRFVVRWPLDTAAVVAASEGSWTDPGSVERLMADATVLIGEDANGDPVRMGAYQPCQGLLLCTVPADIEALRVNHPARARAWRTALHDTIGPAMADGYAASAITRDGWYVLDRPRPEDATR